MKRSTFDQRFKEALEIRRMTQTELHERTGISKGSISTYLKGTWKPKQDKVDLISQALRVDPAWLMGYDVPMDTGEPDYRGVEKHAESYYTNEETARMAQELKDNPNGRILFDASRDLSPEDINIVLNLIKGLKAKEGINK